MNLNTTLVFSTNISATLSWNSAYTWDNYQFFSVRIVCDSWQRGMASIWLRSFVIKKEKEGCPLYPGSRENSGYVPDPKCNHIMRLNVSQHSNKDMLLNNANFQQPALFRFSSLSFSCIGSRNMLTSVPRNSRLRPGKMLRSNMDNIPVKQTTLFCLKQFLFKILFRRFLINVLIFFLQ